MKTIHLQKLSAKERVQLIKKLYKKILKNDDKFHFFYEPNLVIRATEDSIVKIKELLSELGYKFDVYEYPTDKKKKGFFCFECEDYVLNNLEYFIQLYHLHSVLFFKLNKQEYYNYIGRTMHTACNIGGYSYLDEAEMSMERGRFYYSQTIKSIYEQEI